MNKEDLANEIVKGNVSTIAFYNSDGSNMLYTQKYVEEQNKEIERLNNIIDELEKYLFSQLQEYGGGGIVQEYYDKLKELKEKSGI